MLLRLSNAEAIPVSLGEQPEGAHGGGQMLDGFGGFDGGFVSVDDFFDIFALENLRNIGWSSEKIGPISID